MTSTPRRTRIAWLIGGIVLMGIGMIVWGSRQEIRIQYHIMRIRWSGPEYNKDAERALSEMGVEVVPHVIKLFEKRRYSEIADEILQKIGEPAGPYLLNALSSPNVEIRRNVAFVIGAIGDPPSKEFARAAREALLLAINDQDVEVRANAADALMDLGELPEETMMKLEKISDEYKIPWH